MRFGPSGSGRHRQNVTAHLTVCVTVPWDSAWRGGWEGRLVCSPDLTAVPPKVRKSLSILTLLDLNGG